MEIREFYRHIIDQALKRKLKGPLIRFMPVEVVYGKEQVHDFVDKIKAFFEFRRQAK